MARKKAHEEHANHEAWAIPYGDLITLLLALFVVLYSMSSVNEGKYRVLSDSLNEAFGGKPRSVRPVQIGDKPPEGTNSTARVAPIMRRGISGEPPRPPQPPEQKSGAGSRNLRQMAGDVEQAMHELIERKMIVVRRTDQFLEIEIRTDILFASGAAGIADSAQVVLRHLAGIVKPFPNPIRIEGHTDNVPISTLAFPSNWQLSSARAASVVSLFMQSGVDPTRMIVAGFGEYHPAAANDTAEGRNRNRRVLIVVLAEPDPVQVKVLGDALGNAAATEDDPAAHQDAKPVPAAAAQAEVTEPGAAPSQPVSIATAFHSERQLSQ